MKVGVFLDSYLPQDGGGYTMQSELFRALCRIHTKAAHEFVIISQPNNKVEEETEQAGLGWLPYFRPGFFERTGAFVARTWPNLRGHLKSRSSFERKARQAGIEYIWFLGPRPLVLDLPYLAIVLDLQHRKQPWFPEVSEYGEWETRERRLAHFLRRAAGVIAGTKSGKEEISRFFQIPENRIYLLPHPTPDYVKTISTASEVLQRFDLAKDFLFYPAQFWAHKNHVNLLIALKQLADEGLKIPLVLTGSDFGNRGYLRRKITELGLGDQVRILGFVEPAELISLYENALALTYMSFFGPENLPPLEAFALSCPVIAAKVDGSEEQLGDAALLVNPESPEEIAAAIRRLHDDKEMRSKLMERGRERATRWSSEDFVLGVFKILDEFEPIRCNWDH